MSDAPLKPVIVVTVYRRYHELELTLKNIRHLASEFGCEPDVVVVWACPEVGRLWFMQQIQRDGLVQRVLGRLAVPQDGEGKPTTYPESLNIRMGLEWVRANYDASTTYAIVQSADVLAKAGKAYRWIDESFQGGSRAAVCHWNNDLVNSNIWHTNFFGVCLDEAYWPPVSGVDSDDVLEWQWGKQLMETRPPGVSKSNNSGQRRFFHHHLSESQPVWPVQPQVNARDASLLISGSQAWWRRLAERLWLVRPFRRRHE